MARKSKEKIIEELTKLGVDFDARESYDNLKNQLDIEIRDRKGQQQSARPDTNEEDENLLPLTPHERMRLKELERMANMGRKIDQPTPEEGMKELSKLRKRADL